MPKEQVTLPALESLRDELEAIEGVHRAFVEGPPFEIDLICDGDPAGPPVEAAVHALMIARDVDPGEVRLRVAYEAAPKPRRRVRFMGLDLQYPHVGQAVATAQLEWRDAIYEGRAEGQGGDAAVLRACAVATARALEGVLDGKVSLSLVGTKAARIFDCDMVAVLLHSDEAPGRQLIGIAQVTDTQHRSAALAVLNATNRALGNYLSNGD